jgi:hypothetical protein
MEKNYNIAELKEKTERFCFEILDDYKEDRIKGPGYYVDKFKFGIAQESGLSDNSAEYWLMIASYCANYAAVKEKKEEGTKARDEFVIGLLTTFGFDIKERKEILSNIISARLRKEEAACKSRALSIRRGLERKLERRI